MPTWMKKLSGVLGSKWWPWAVFSVVLVLMVAYFIYAWTGHAPTTGPDHTDPWKQ